MEDRVYELTVILPEDKMAGEVEAMAKDWLTKSGGKLLKNEFWGKKQLTYPIRKQSRGVYGYFEIAMKPKEVVELQKRISLEEGLYRHLLVIKNKRVKEEKKVSAKTEK